MKILITRSKNVHVTVGGHSHKPIFGWLKTIVAWMIALFSGR